MIEGHLHLHASAEDPLMKGAEVRQRTDFESGVLEGGVSEESQLDRHFGRAATEKDILAEVGRFRRDHLQAEHVPIELGERDRVPRTEGNVADTDYLRRSLLSGCHVV